MEPLPARAWPYCLDAAVEKCVEDRDPFHRVILELSHQKVLRRYKEAQKFREEEKQKL